MKKVDVRNEIKFAVKDNTLEDFQRVWDEARQAGAPFDAHVTVYHLAEYSAGRGAEIRFAWKTEREY